MSRASKDSPPENNMMMGAPGPSGTNTACAACKYQRRKCAADCPLAPFFPPDQPRRFLNVHRLFGVSSILRILRQVDPDKREDTVKSIVYEADTRDKDPVHGCLGVINLLQNQVTKLKEELALARDQLYMMEQQHASSILHQAYAHQHGSGQSNYLHHQLQQQQQQQHQQQQQQQYGTAHHGGGFHDAAGQVELSYQDNKSLQPAYHDHSRYLAEDSAAAFHDMIGHHIKVETINPYNRAAAMRFGADTPGTSLQEQQASSSYALAADLQRRNFYNQFTDTHGAAGRHVDPLRSVTGLQDLDPLTNQTPHVSEHELRNAGVHLSLTNQYSL